MGSELSITSTQLTRPRGGTYHTQFCCEPTQVDVREGASEMIWTNLKLEVLLGNVCYARNSATRLTIVSLSAQAVLEDMAELAEQEDHLGGEEEGELCYIICNRVSNYLFNL